MELAAGKKSKSNSNKLFLSIFKSISASEQQSKISIQKLSSESELWISIQKLKSDSELLSHEITGIQRDRGCFEAAEFFFLRYLAPFLYLAILLKKLIRKD